MKTSTQNTGAIALAKMFSGFLEDNAGKRSAYTITGYRMAMKSFAMFAQQRLGADTAHFDITYFNEQNVSRYLEWLQDKQGTSPQTCNLRLCQLRSFLKYASREPAVMPYYLSLKQIERYIADNRTKVVEPLSKAAIVAIMGAPGTGTETGLRYTLLISMLYTMALRMDEVLSIKIKDMKLDASKPYVTVVGKGRKARTAYFMRRQCACCISTSSECTVRIPVRMRTCSMQNPGANSVRHPPVESTNSLQYMRPKPENHVRKSQSTSTLISSVTQWPHICWKMA